MSYSKNPILVNPRLVRILHLLRRMQELPDGMNVYVFGQAYHICERSLQRDLQTLGMAGFRIMRVDGRPDWRRLDTGLTQGASRGIIGV